MFEVDDTRFGYSVNALECGQLQGAEGKIRPLRSAPPNALPGRRTAPDGHRTGGTTHEKGSTRASYGDGVQKHSLLEDRGHHEPLIANLINSFRGS
jgi:hypothetical protein